MLAWLADIQVSYAELLSAFGHVVSCVFFFFSSRRRHTRFDCDWSSDVCLFRSFWFFVSPIFSCWNATANWLTKNQKAAADFVAAIQQANDFINNQPGQFRAYLGKTTKMA